MNVSADASPAYTPYFMGASIVIEYVRNIPATAISAMLLLLLSSLYTSCAIISLCTMLFFMWSAFLSSSSTFAFSSSCILLPPYRICLGIVWLCRLLSFLLLGF